MLTILEKINKIIVQETYVNVTQMIIFIPNKGESPKEWRLKISDTLYTRFSLIFSVLVSSLVNRKLKY